MSQYIHVSNHYVVHLKHNNICQLHLNKNFKMKVVGLQEGEVPSAGRSQLLSWTVRTVLLAQPPLEGNPTPRALGKEVRQARLRG